MNRKIAAITGISGQDGSYLAEFLLEKEYQVIGIVRRTSHKNLSRIEHLISKYGSGENNLDRLILNYGDLSDSSSLKKIISKFNPDEFYNLGAQSHVGISFDNALSTLDFDTLGVLRILDSLREIKSDCRFYQASSSEIFGNSPPPQNENTTMLPRSPYAIAKLASYHLTRLYREAYGMHASNGILFNHESPKRGLNFVTRKITSQLAEIAVGERKKITLGNLEAKRDWGFSGEYIQAMWKMLQQESPDDFVISTDETHTVRDFLNEAFSLLNLDYKDYVQIDNQFKRPSEVPELLGDSTKARQILGWEPKIKFKELTRMMVVEDLKEKFKDRQLISSEEANIKEDNFYINKAIKLINN